VSPLTSRDYVAIRHPGQVRLQRTRAGIQKEVDYIAHSLDSPSTMLRTVSLSNGLSNHGSRPVRRHSSGMTGSANCDILSNGRGDF
jgi:hypothetical protein